MALSIEQKKAVVAEVSEVARSALAAVAAEYRGLTVEEMTDLRVKAREGGVYLKVAKNTLTRRAVEGTEFECMSESLTGPLLLAFSLEDPGAAARLFKDFARENEDFEVKALAVSGQMLGAEQLDVLAKLPTRDQALSMLMSVMKAPATKLVRLLSTPGTQMAQVLKAHQEETEKE